MKKHFIIFLILSICISARGTEVLYLSGRGCDSTVEWDFLCTAGRNSNVWTKIPVPSNWECQGFGQYTYGHMPLQERLNEKGFYRHTFNVPASWKGMSVEIVFGGVMTDAEVRLNGKSAGEIHRGGYYEFRYDVSKLLRYGGSNTLEVEVDKLSSDSSIVGAESQADFWVFGGIYRPVTLEARPAVHIRNFGIDARADGAITVSATLGGRTDGCGIVGQVRTLDGEKVGEPFRAEAGSVLSAVLPSIRTWTAETPNLYELELSLVKGNRVLHSCTGRFGFRTVEVRPGDGVYVNGVRIKMRGVDRHSFWPTTGRTLSDSINLKDALLIKEMNMNAVRCSHYPPEKRFLDLCDSLGLYVIDELTGWQSKYDTETGKPLVREMVLRDRNHPSILFWANGNEGGFNFDLKPEYSRWDPQQRPVIHPWLEDDVINTCHYPSWDSVRDFLSKGRKIWFPTEFDHGLYDGGHGAGLEDYWSIMQADVLCAGGFLWDMTDQGIVRDDLDGRLDTDGNHGADGILGPFREKEGSFYAIRDIWSPVQLEWPSLLPPTFDGRIVVENRYNFTNLSECRFEAGLVRVDFLGKKSSSRKIAVPSPDVPAGMKGILNVSMPHDFAGYDAMYVSAFGPDGKEICTWTRNIRTAADYARSVLAEDRSVAAAESPVTGIRFIGDPGDESRLEVARLDDGWTEVSYVFARRGYFSNAGVTFDFPEDGVESVSWTGNGPYRVWKNRLRGVTFGLWEKEYNDTVTGESWDYPEFKGYHSNMYAADINTSKGTLRIVFASDDLYLRLFTPAKPAARNNDNTLGVFPDGQISVLNCISAVGTKFSKAKETGPQGDLSYIEYNSRKRIAQASGRFYYKFIGK